MRRRLIVAMTFLGGLYYFLEFMTPKYLPVSVPTKHQFMVLGVACGGNVMHDERVAFETTEAAVAACRKLGVDAPTVPPRLAGRAMRLEWIKSGKMAGRIGVRLEVDGAPGDPRRLPAWDLTPAYWTSDAETTEGVTAFMRACAAEGGEAGPGGEKTFVCAFASAREAQLAARKLGGDVDLPVAWHTRATRLTRQEGGRLVCRVERDVADAAPDGASWRPEPPVWGRDVYAFSYFMLGGQHEAISEIFIVIGVAAIGLGVINVLRAHGSRLILHRRGWLNSLALLVAMVVMMVAGFYDWHLEVAEQRADRFEKRTLAFARTEAVQAWEAQGANGARPAADQFEELEGVSPEAAARKAAMLPSAFDRGMEHFFKDVLMGLGGLFVGLSSAMFSLLALYMASAAYRAFRIRSGEAAFMMAAALLVMLGQIPMGTAMCDPLFRALGVSGGIASARSWLMEVVNTAAFRGIYFGAAIAGLAMGIRMWLSIESGTVPPSGD